ncbi:MAG: sigma-54 dependent transcriptional regulator [Tannerella sp.]|jgi:two-component system NtrC family response regulator|nr:sigma-54 dependent transcriptional regulator [Tannerella sp.]
MILIVDDDAAVRSSLTFLLKRAGHEPQAVATPGEALELIRRTTPLLILMDMNFTLTTSGEEGLLLLRQVKILTPGVPVILITAWGSISLAVQGMQNGAFDFITKPWNNHALLNSINTAIELTGQKTGPLNRTDADKKAGFDKIIGKSDALMNILGTVSRIAPTNAPVLITGESGTGKELVAEAIHENSKRAGKAFVKVNLGGLSHSLFESEMFGHKKGAFTDAFTDRSGRFEIADKGTIFLDEIGELDLSCQVKLLRVLQDQTFEVLGDSRPRKTDVRVISATNRNLGEMVADRTFREDLFYRINLITIHLPPLRERTEDIPLLAAYFAGKQAVNSGREKVKFTPGAIAYLKNQPYPGNIRELKNLVERTILVSEKTTLEAADFEMQNQNSRANKTGAGLSGLTLDEIEKQTILQAIEKHSGNVSHVASVLGVSRAALYRRLEKYGIRINKTS